MAVDVVHLTIFNALRRVNLTERAAFLAAAEVVGDLQKEGCLAGLDRLYSVAVVATRFGRSTKWVRQQAENGRFGKIANDGGGLLISEAGIQEYLSTHALQTAKELAETEK